jgi:hypothetical protein
MSKLNDINTEIDATFTAVEDGDCRRAWKHLGNAASGADEANAERVEQLHRQLSKSCPVGASSPVDEARFAAIVEQSPFWLLAAIFGIGGAILLWRAFKSGAVSGIPGREEFHGFRESPMNNGVAENGVFQGRVVG